ncbi:unnamed protein product [Musa acuminata var. zebrina]
MDLSDRFFLAESLNYDLEVLKADRSITVRVQASYDFRAVLQARSILAAQHLEQNLRRHIPVVPRRRTQQRGGGLEQAGKVARVQFGGVHLQELLHAEQAVLVRVAPPHHLPHLLRGGVVPERRHYPLELVAGDQPVVVRVESSERLHHAVDVAQSLDVSGEGPRVR